MVGEKKQKTEKVFVMGLLGLLFAGCLVVLSQIQYSDGDDAFFLEYCGSMEFFSYLKWRYETWTGRMISEGMMHLFFNSDLWLWRVVNAAMLTAMPVSLVWIKHKITNRIEAFDFWFALLFYFLIDIKTFGYSCIWITGSMNYLWPAVCGLTALWAIAAEVFETEEFVLLEDRKYRQTGKYAAAIFCAVIAGMSSEQMGAVILAFSMIGIGVKLWQKEKIKKRMICQTIVTAGAFAFSSFAPGNALRVAASVEIYMPQFDTLTLGQRLFLLIQWLVSSFANENAMLLTAIWLAGIFLLFDKLKRENLRREETICAKICMGGCVVFGAVALLGKAGVQVLCDIGMTLSELTGTVESVPEAAQMTGVQWAVLLWWSAAMLFTFFLLWKLTNGMSVVLLTYLGAIACEVILIFSPTIYSSGERVFFVTGILLMGILLLLLDKLQKEKMGVKYIGIVTVLAFGNFWVQIPELLEML